MKYAILFIAVVIALFASYIYGVGFGRKVELDAVMNANRVISASPYSVSAYYTPAYSYNYTTDYSSDADYTPNK